MLRSHEPELPLRGNLLLAFIPFFAGLVSSSSTALARGACGSRFFRLGIGRSRVLRPSLRPFNPGTLRLLVRFRIGRSRILGIEVVVGALSFPLLALDLRVELSRCAAG